MSYRIQVKEIRVRNFMCFNEVNIKLKNLCTFITGEESECGKSALIAAIKFILSAEYIDGDDAIILKKMPDVGDVVGYVKLTLLLVDEQDQSQKELIAVRTFANIDIIYYKIDENEYFESVEHFQKIFKTNLMVRFPGLDCSIKHFPEHTNLLQFWISGRKFESMEYFKENVSILENALQDEDGEVSESSKLSISQERLLIYLERLENFKNFIQLTSLISATFWRLTSENCTVKFYIEDNGELLHLTSTNLSDKTLQNVVTFIKRGELMILWTSLEEPLKCLLKISTQIAYSVYFENQFVFIDIIDIVKQNQDLELAKSAIVTNHFPESSIARKNNFLQNIVDVCSTFNLNAFLEYRGVVIVENANIVRCEFKTTAATCKLVEKSLSLAELVKIFQKYFSL